MSEVKICKKLTNSLVTLWKLTSIYVIIKFGLLHIYVIRIVDYRFPPFYPFFRPWQQGYRNAEKDSETTGSLSTVLP